MIIRNINGTSQNACSCGSWLEHWKKFSGKLPLFCPVLYCYEKVAGGAHVQKDSSTDKSWYIVPLCKKHNDAEGYDFVVSDATVLVSANVSETCGG